MVVLLISYATYAQGLLNNGAKIVITSGTNVYIDGGASGNFTNATNSTDGEIDLDGKIIVEGNFTNNSNGNVFINTDTDGEVVFAGTTQNITSSSADMSNFIDFEKVTINDGSTTNLQAGSAATVNGALLVNSAGKFVLKSPADNGATGSLITKGTVTSTDADDIIVERHYETGGRYQYLGVPVQNAQISDFSISPVTGNFNPNVYSYNEAYDVNDASPGNPTNTTYAAWNDPTWELYNAWQSVATTNTSSYFNPSTGYISYNEGDLDIEFKGGNNLLNRANSYSPAVSFNSNDGNSDFFDGWNLVSNPYPCALDWANGAWTRTNITNSIYFWDGTNYVYSFHTGDDHDNYFDVTLNDNGGSTAIPAMQAFFIKATAAPSFSIPEDARTHAADAMYKKNNPTYSLLKLSLSTANNKSDEIAVRFIENASPLFDNQLDAYKIYNNSPEVPQLYSLVNQNGTDLPIAINSLPIPENDDYQIIPLGVVAKQSGEYTFTAKELSNYDFDEIVLVDYGTNGQTIKTELLETTSYTCFIEEGETRDRFALFASTRGQEPNSFKENTTTGVNIYSHKNKIFVNIGNKIDQNGVISMFDISGKKVFEQKNNKLFNSFQLNLTSGIYIAKYTSKSNTYSKKVFIK